MLEESLCLDLVASLGAFAREQHMVPISAVQAIGSRVCCGGDDPERAPARWAEVLA